MTTEGRQPVDGAISPLPLERFREESGLTWRGLAARIGVNDRAMLSGVGSSRDARAVYPNRNPDKDTEEELPMTFDNDHYEPSLSKGYPPPPLPEDWWVPAPGAGQPFALSRRAHRRRDAGHPGVGLLGAGRRRGAAAGLRRTLALPEVENGTPPTVRLPHRAGAVSRGLPPPAGPLPAGRRVHLGGSGSGTPGERPYGAALEGRS